MAVPPAFPPVEKRGLSDHLQIIGSTAAGVLSGEFFAEYAARAKAVTGWTKAVLKGIVKTAWGGFWLWLSTQTVSPKIKQCMEYAGYGSIGSTILDVIAAAYPGGIPGLATALALRGAATQALPTLKRAVTPPPPAPTPPPPAPAPLPARPLPPPAPAPAPAPAARITAVAPSPAPAARIVGVTPAPAPTPTPTPTGRSL